MKHWRKAALFLAAAMLLLCAGCGNSATAYDRGNSSGSGGSGSSSSLRIGYSAVANSDAAPWAGVVWDTIEAACEEQGWEMVGFSGGGVPSTQGKQIDSLLAENPDYVIIFAGDVQMADDWVKKVHNAGIPVIMANIDATSDAYTYVSAYVGPDQEALAGQLATDMIKANGADAGLNVVCISGFENQQDYILRKQGFETTLTYFSNYTLLGTDYAGASRDDAKSIMDDYFSKYEDKIDIVMCYDDEFAMGALDSIEEHGKTGQIQIYSITGSNEALSAVEEGLIAEVAMNPAAEIAEGCIDIISGLNEGIIPNHYNYTTRTYVTSENVSEYSGKGEY